MTKPNNLAKHMPAMIDKIQDVRKALDYPTFYETIVASPEWQGWIKHCEETLEWDVHESIECGWLSPAHFAAFLEWYKKRGD